MVVINLKKDSNNNNNNNFSRYPFKSQPCDMVSPSILCSWGGRRERRERERGRREDNRKGFYKLSTASKIVFSYQVNEEDMSNS